MTDTSPDAYENAVADVQQRNDLHFKIRNAAQGAINYGHATREWVNTKLAALGVDPIAGENTYRLNLPVTALYGRQIKASSRAEALQKFQAEVDERSRNGKVTHNDIGYANFYRLTFNTEAEPTFFSGPEDTPAEPVDLSLDELKAGIRAMIMEGVAEGMWGYRHGQRQLAEMGIEAMPAWNTQYVDVPVSGTARVSVTMFEGEDADALQARVTRKFAQLGQQVVIQADEVGAPVAQDASEADESNDPF